MTGVEVSRMNAIEWSLGDVGGFQLMMILISFPENECTVMDKQIPPILLIHINCSGIC